MKVPTKSTKRPSSKRPMKHQTPNFKKTRHPVWSLRLGASPCHAVVHRRRMELGAWTLGVSALTRSKIRIRIQFDPQRKSKTIPIHILPRRAELATSAGSLLPCARAALPTVMKEEVRRQNEEGRDGALRRPRRSAAQRVIQFTRWVEFVPHAQRERGHRSAMSLPFLRLLNGLPENIPMRRVSRPSGTRLPFTWIPALKRRAIFKRPSGTWTAHPPHPLTDL